MTTPATSTAFPKEPLRFTNLLSVPTLVVPHNVAIDASFADTFVYSLQGYAASEISVSDSHLADSLELYVRKLLSRCARTIYIPSHAKRSVLNPGTIRALLTPSTRKHLSLVDARETIWKATKAYFEPIRLSLPNVHEFPSLDFIAWDFYCLALTTKYSCEFIHDPARTLRAIDYLSPVSSLATEARARLAKVRGLFQLFTVSDEIVGFRIIPALSQHCVLERIDEILEDAYLLEASKLRRFLNISANKAALKRDVRTIVNHIVKKRPWAKGIAEAGVQLALRSSGQTVDLLGAILKGAASALTATDINPVLLKPDWALYGDLRSRGELLLQAHRCLSKKEPNNWTVTAL